MNANLLTVVKRIVAEQGDGILAEPRRVSAFFADLAKDEPKPQKNAFVKCLEQGFAQTLKNASEQDRALCRQRLAQRLHDDEGLDLELCNDTVELLAAVLFGAEQKKKENVCKNCGKELQEGWKACPHCAATVANVSQVISSAISSGSGSWGHSDGQIKPVAPVFSNNSQTQQPEASTTILYEGICSLWVYEPGCLKNDGGEKPCKFVLTNDSINFVPSFFSRLNGYNEEISVFIPFSTIKEIKKTKYALITPAIEFTCYDQYSYRFCGLGLGAGSKVYKKMCELCGLNEYKEKKQ